MKTGPVSWIVLVVALLGLSVVWSARVAGYGGMLSNDQLFNIASGIDLRQARGPVSKFYDAAVKACSGDEACEKNQIVLMSEMPHNYPVAGLTGLWLASQGVPDDFSRFAFRATALSLILGFFCALAILLLQCSVMNALERLVLASGVLASVFLLAASPAPTIATNLLGLNTLATVTCLLLAMIAGPLLLSRFLSTPVIAASAGGATIVMLAGLACAILARTGMLPQAGLPAVALALLGLVWSVSRPGTSAASATGLGLAIVISLSSPDFFAPLAHVVPRSNVFLAVLPILMVSLLRPHSLWILLLPLGAMFHVSSTALIALMLFCAEIWMLVLGRGSRILLLVSGGTGLVLYLYTRLTFTGLTQGGLPGALLLEKLQSLQMLAAIVIAAMGVAFASWLARAQDGRPGSARAVLLLVGVFLLYQISGLLSGISMFSEGMYVLSRAYVYCAPALLTAVVVVLLAELLIDRNGGGRVATLNGRGFAAAMLLIICAWNVPAGPDLGTLAATERSAWRGLYDFDAAIPGDLASVKYDSSYPIRCGKDTATDSLKFLSYAKLRFKLREDPSHGDKMRVELMGDCP